MSKRKTSRASVKSAGKASSNKAGGKSRGGQKAGGRDRKRPEVDNAPLCAGASGPTAHSSESARKTSEAQAPLGRLVQLAGGNDARLRGFVAVGRQVFAAGGAPTQGGAYELTFELDSAGLLKDRVFAAELADITPPTPLVRAVGRMQAAMGAEETGGLRAMASKAIAAAGPVTGAGPSDPRPS